MAFESKQVVFEPSSVGTSSTRRRKENQYQVSHSSTEIDAIKLYVHRQVCNGWFKADEPKWNESRNEFWIGWLAQTIFLPLVAFDRRPSQSRANCQPAPPPGVFALFIELPHVSISSVVLMFTVHQRSEIYYRHIQIGWNLFFFHLCFTLFRSSHRLKHFTSTEKALSCKSLVFTDVIFCFLFLLQVSIGKRWWRRSPTSKSQCRSKIYEGLLFRKKNTMKCKRGSVTLPQSSVIVSYRILVDVVVFFFVSGLPRFPCIFSEHLDCETICNAIIKQSEFDWEKNIFFQSWCYNFDARLPS